jgi:outer membrane receptor for ferrienterochelin and colicin
MSSHRARALLAGLLCLHAAGARAQPADPAPPSASEPNDSAPVAPAPPSEEVHGAPAEAEPAAHDAAGDVVEEPPAWEPEPTLVDYVSASTKLTEPARRSPSSVWVIDREQIEIAGYRSVAEALTAVPGLLVSYDLDNYNVALRGLYGGARAGSRYLKVMIDGRAISFAQSGVHYLGPEFIPMIAVERIEVVRGPVSSLYGAGALVGAINVVTRRPSYEGSLTSFTSFDAGGAAIGARGGFGSGVQMLVGRRSFLLLAVGAGYLDRSGLTVPRESPFREMFVDDTGAPLKSQNDTTRPMSAVVRGEQYAGGGRFSGIGALQLHDAVNEFHDLRALGHGNRSQLYAGGVGINFERPTRSRLTVLASAGLWLGGTRGGEAYDLAPTESYRLTRRLSYQLLEGGLELRYDTENQGWLQLGVDGQLDRERMPVIIEIDRDTGAERARPDPGTRNLANVGVYSQVLLPLHDKLRAAATLRWDQHSIYGGALSARAALVTTPTPQLAIKLMGGRSYKAPSPEQLFGVGLNTLDITGDDTIPPQYLNGGELLVDYYLAPQVNVNVGGYYQRYSDTLSYIRLGTGLTAKPFDADSYGIEAMLRTSVPVGSVRIAGSAGLALQQLVTESKIVGGVREKSVPDNEGVPTQMFNARLAVFGPKGSGGQVMARYVGARTPSQSNLLLASGNPDMTNPIYMLQPYTLVDASLASWAIPLSTTDKAKPNLRVRTGVSNLLDVRYSEIGFNGVDIPALGRTVWASGTVEF